MRAFSALRASWIRVSNRVPDSHEKGAGWL